MADETAVLGLPEVTVRVIPDGGGTQLLVRRVGSSRAADLVFTGRKPGAEEADWLGLLDRRVPAGLARSVAMELAETIAENSPVGVRSAKRALRLGPEVDLAARPGRRGRGLARHRLLWGPERGRRGLRRAAPTGLARGVVRTCDCSAWSSYHAGPSSAGWRGERLADPADLPQGGAA